MTAPSVVEVSVILPAYNEEATLERSATRTLDTLDGFLPDGTFEVIIAEDGCTDRTPAIASRLAAGDDRVRHYHADDRLGRGRALEGAVEAARGGTIAYLDTDLATDLGYLEELVQSVRSDGYDIATGSRLLPGHTVDRPAKRGVPSRIYNDLIRLLLGSDVRDHQCGFKAFDRDVLRSLLPAVEDGHWFWDTEVLVLAQRAGYRVKEFPVAWTQGDDTSVDLIRDVLGMGSQIIRLGWQLRVQPHLTRGRSIAAGIVLSVLAVVLMAQYIDFGDVLLRMGRVDRGLLIGATLVYLSSWPIRGGRYRVILARLGHRHRIGFLTGAVFVSQTANLVFPARAGDAVRAYIVKTRREVPYPTGFASLAVERVLDLLTITAIGVVVLLGFLLTGWPLDFAPGGRAGDPVARSGRTAVRVAGIVGIVALTVLVGILLSERSDANRVESLVGRFSSDLYARSVSTALGRFIRDVQSVVADGRTFATLGAYSAVIWSIDVVTAAMVLAAFDGVGLAPLPILAVCFFAVSIGNLAKVLPLSPGGIGLYEGAFTLLVVGTTGLPATLALGAAVIDHAVKNIVTIVGGGVSMVVLNVSLRTAVEEAQEGSTTEAD